MPDRLHAVPVRHDAVLERKAERELVALAMRLVTYHVRAGLPAPVLAADDRRKDRFRTVVARETRLDHARTIVQQDSCGLVVILLIGNRLQISRLGGHNLDGARVDGGHSLLRLHFSDETRPVNLGNPDEISIAEFANEILALTGADVEVEHRDLPENDPKQRRPDITRARDVLNWEPKVARAEGLKRTYEFFKGLSDADLRKSEHKDFERYTTR